MWTFETMVGLAQRADGIPRSALRFGDRLLVRTRNSVYSIWVLGEGTYQVAGGWFDRKRLSPATVGINGCTLGGSAIATDWVACPGMCLEFSNRVTTTRIERVELQRAGAADPTVH